MSGPEPVLSDAAIAVPLSPPSAAIERGRAVAVRDLLICAVIFLVPLFTYWQTTFHQYGLRDDYSNLREAHEEPGKIVQFCASHARPIYGWLLQATYGAADTIHDLQWMRLLTSMLLGAIALFMFRGLRVLGWSFNSSLYFAVSLSLVPSVQAIAGWALGWPYASTALLALCSFFVVESGLALRPNIATGRLVGQWLVALCLMVLCVLTYQPSALFYVVPFTAALIAQRHRNVAQTARWTALHLGVVVTAMACAYATVSVLYAQGIFVKSGRIAFEHDWVAKAVWYVGENLPNTLSFYVLNDNNHRDQTWYLACAALVGAILVMGAALEWRRYGRTRGLIWAAALIGLPIFACAVSLVASERFATYRTVFAMTAVVLCFVIASLGSMTRGWAPGVRKTLAIASLAAGMVMANHHAFGLIAATQGHEWQIIKDGAKQVILGPSPVRVFAIASSPADISTGTIYHDEFGSLSSNSEWVPKEMFKRAMHDLHPGVADLESRYEFSENYKLPPDAQFDVIIDMHRLRQYYQSY